MRIMGRRVVLSVLLVALVAPAQGSAIPAAASQPCARGRPAFSSWRIPGTNGRSGWRPLAVDGNRLVMVEGLGDLVARPGPLTMAVVTAGSARYRPIPSGAYPHAGVLQRWQLSWPWLVGVFNFQSMPTLGWTLWAGNLQTGKHIVLDQLHAISKTTTNHAFPDFDLSDGKVVWTWISYSLRPQAPMRSRIALYDLAMRRETFLKIPVSSQRYGNPTLWGTRIVWERYTDFPCTHAHCPNQVIDLQLYDLATHHLQTLTHSSFRTGNSFSPGLGGNNLVFQHGPQDAWGGGTIIMVDLASHVPGTHRFWWQSYRYRMLEPRRTVGLDVRDGLASWDGGVADLLSGRSAKLPWGEEQWSGGRSLVVQPITYSGPQPYTLLRLKLKSCLRRMTLRPRVARAETIAARNVVASRSLASVRIPSFQLQETTTSWPANSGLAGLASYWGPVRSTSTWWYASPRRWRVSGRYLVPPRVPGMWGDEILGGTSFEPVPGTVASDGRDIWRYYRRDRQVQVEHIMRYGDAVTQFSFPVGIAPFGQSWGNLPTLLAHPRRGCYGKPTVRGSATIAGRQVSVVDLGLPLCVSGSGSSREAAGRAIIWVDKQTYFVLQYRLYDPANPSKLLTQTTVTSVRYHTSIDPRLLHFKAPAGTVIDDMRPRAMVAARPYNRGVSRLAPRLAFPLLAPCDRPAGLTWSMPRLLAQGSVLLAFLPPAARASSASRVGVTIVERRARAADLERHASGAQWVAVSGAAGWFGETPAGHRLRLVREGTAIALTSRVLGGRALIALASVIGPVSGGHEPVAVPGMPILRTVRQELAFPIFVPTMLPAGLKIRSITQGDGRKNPPNSVEIDYGGRGGPLRLFQGFAGCCLDQDLRKWDDRVRLPDRVIAFRFLGGWPHFLWWDQAGTFIGLTGPNLTERELMQIAGSMSRTATPRSYRG